MRDGNLKNILIIPRNGLGNRLQAWASAAILANSWELPLKIYWGPEKVWAAPAEQLFQDAPYDKKQEFVNEDYAIDLLEAGLAETPRFLWADEEKNIILLSGDRFGEQYFMSDLKKMIANNPKIENLAIIAGGIFNFDGPITDPNFIAKRREFYRKLNWHMNVTKLVSNLSDRYHTYSSLHIRTTDRSLEAPLESKVKKALIGLANSSESQKSSQNLFISADTQFGVSKWKQVANDLGFNTFSYSQVDYSRSTISAGIFAAADWVTLSKSRAIIHAAVSTFSSEAGVASGGELIPLSAAKHIKLKRQIATYRNSILRKLGS